jgi:hypothetical protein
MIFKRKTYVQRWEEKKERVERWRPWFAWCPVSVEDENGFCGYVWLQKIWRKGRVQSIGYADLSGYWEEYHLTWKYRVPFSQQQETQDTKLKQGGLS